MYLLSRLGVEPTALTAIVGIIGLAASLSLQSVLQNLVAGVYLLAEHPFAIGDDVTIVGPTGLNHEGRVEDIQMRTTHLRNRTDELILVPNSAVFNGVVTNRTTMGGIAAHISVTFPRQIDPESVRAQVFPLLQGLSFVLSSPRPELRVERVGKDDWTGSVLFWARAIDSSSDAIWAIGHAFPQAIINCEATAAGAT